MIIPLAPLPAGGGGVSSRWPIEDQVSALHEGAHVCAALHARMIVHSVTIRETILSRGTSSARGRGIVALVGGAVAARFGSPMSEADATLLSEARKEAGVDILDRSWWLDAKAFVRKHDADIRRLAVAILQRRTLDGLQCIAVLGPHWRPAPAVQPVRL